MRLKLARDMDSQNSFILIPQNDSNSKHFMYIISKSNSSCIQWAKAMVSIVGLFKIFRATFLEHSKMLDCYSDHRS